MLGKDMAIMVVIIIIVKESEKAGIKLSVPKSEGHGICFHHFMRNSWGKKWKKGQILFSWAP